MGASASTPSRRTGRLIRRPPRGCGAHRGLLGVRRWFGLVLEPVVAVHD